MFWIFISVDMLPKSINIDMPPNSINLIGFGYLFMWNMSWVFINTNMSLSIHADMFLDIYFHE